MTKKYRTTTRETQNLNSWSVSLGPAVILNTTWWTWVGGHRPAILIKALHYNYHFCRRWIKTGLVETIERVGRVLLIVAKRPSCRTKWSEWDNACQCSIIILICISLINPQESDIWNDSDGTRILLSLKSLSWRQKQKQKQLSWSLIKQGLREMGRPCPVTSLV